MLPITVSALLPVNKRHLVIAIGSSVGHDALDGQGEPGFRVGDEGCGLN